MARVGMGVTAVRRVELLAEVRAEDMVVGVVTAQRRRACRPTVIAPDSRTDIVRIVPVHRRPACPVVAVEILPVARRGAEREAARAPEPPERRERRRGVFPLVGIVGRIESVGPEIPVLVSGLEIEQSGTGSLADGPHVGIAIGKVRIVPVTVAAAEGSRAEHREASLGDGSRKVGIGIAVLSARTLEAQVGRPQRRRADVHRPGEGPDARQAVEQLHRRDAVEIDRQRVGLVSRAGIREINTVEKDHRLVERASADGDVGLRSLASAFADIDRRREAQSGLQRLDGLRGESFPVEKRGVRPGVPHGSRLGSRDADLTDPQRPEDGGRVGVVRGCAPCREQQDRHSGGEDSDLHVAVQARKDRPALAAPTLEAGNPLLQNVFHVVVLFGLIK